MSEGFNNECDAVPGIFQAELFGHCRDGATDTSETNCKPHPCKEDSRCCS